MKISVRPGGGYLAPLEWDRLVELFQKNPDSKDRHTTIGGFLYTALFTGKTGEQWEAMACDPVNDAQIRLRFEARALWSEVSANPSSNGSAP
ncbi:hypothetical protein [Hyalangium sp.]|uniref:hypothetical protein n=1 Tax=Hyalangium sp. TaxID=2028555 RepID=UPI002D6F40AC|nr:hypothetical protein [Hyalangium sp.]HYI02224.1 hypothetical protein [Hyalangium sp.]